ncbi:MAG: hypothetical protein KGI50_00040 [Patescibacteria group bacterium]|nr:hypothetical protein [Patescibacteria group bacterium]
MEEFPAHANIVICPDDGLVYFKKAWHHRLDDIKHLKEEYKISFERCPVCRMKHEHTYEGELAIMHIPPLYEHDLIRLVQNFGASIFSKDPLDQILRMRRDGNAFYIECSRNQSMLRLAKKISSAFKARHRKQISFSHEPSDVVCSVIDFG